MNKLPDELHPSDIGSLTGDKRSSKDDYYRYMLRREKLKELNSVDFLSAREKQALKATSDREKIELRCLARLYALADHSPEYLQIKSITGGDDREEIAQKLAKLYMERQLVEDVLNRFIAPSKAKDDLRKGSTLSRTLYDAFASE